MSTWDAQSHRLALVTVGRRALIPVPVARILDRTAAEAPMSQATTYRRGVSRDDLVAALMAEAATTYQRAMLPAPSGSGTAGRRLHQALEALCRTADAHLHLLAGMFLAPGAGFHPPGPGALTVEAFAEPLERLLRDRAADGTVRVVEPIVTATVLFNLVGWGYIHLRAAHHWDADTARGVVLDAVLHGLLAAPPQPQART